MPTLRVVDSFESSPSTCCTVVLRPNFWNHSEWCWSPHQRPEPHRLVHCKRASSSWCNYQREWSQFHSSRSVALSQECERNWANWWAITKHLRHLKRTFQLSPNHTFPVLPSLFIRTWWSSWSWPRMQLGFIEGRNVTPPPSLKMTSSQKCSFLALTRFLYLVWLTVCTLADGETVGCGGTARFGLCSSSKMPTNLAPIRWGIKRAPFGSTHSDLLSRQNSKEMNKKRKDGIGVILAFWREDTDDSEYTEWRHQLTGATVNT